uniref:Uncharacterized protein n=1 Tax=Chondria sp. (in: red algae) TaxID=1982705 RepID=A0A1Z1MEG1_9FLOR|nr:hypothetical protein [Chondria sp. (in: red algae)]
MFFLLKIKFEYYIFVKKTKIFNDFSVIIKINFTGFIILICIII